jgi:hypothetical protein
MAPLEWVGGGEGRDVHTAKKKKSFELILWWLIPVVGFLGILSPPSTC